MEETVKLDLTEREAQSFRELIADCVQKMRQIHEAMARDKEEIEQLQAETREILAREWKAV
jgi:methyl-accepting chemotaxis protein